ncbi:MAG: hypothetical protein JW950_03190 [Deltaproteobacteria bacterium]|nr:hypothetical protein [Deltaproteobacteria bacterium]
MITINSYIHRHELNDVIRRWMYDDLRSDDAQRITCLVNFNNVFVARYLQTFALELFSGLHQSEIITRRAFLKGDLKDVLVSSPPVRNPRIDELIEDYHENPGRFYRETPFNGRLFFRPVENGYEYIGSSRIKRIRRLAEKSARKIIDRVFEIIKRNADAMAEERASRLGIPRVQTMSFQEEISEEFLSAERRLLDDLRQHIGFHGFEDIFINDVAGIKMILGEEGEDRLMQLLARRGDCEVIERECHSGRYNAINLIVSFKPSKEEILEKPLSDRLLTVMRARGLTPEEAQRRFVEFVYSGEENVHIEIMLSDFQETLESEIGRCIHEDRIIEQRMNRQYRSYLSKNIEYLMEYLFSFAVSYQQDLGELPIKIWNRYLTDYFDTLIRRLFRIPAVDMPD